MAVASSNLFFCCRDDDYYNPNSVASIKAAEEEQMQEGETIEEYEDRVLNKRAGYLNQVLRAQLEEKMTMNFSELTHKHSKKHSRKQVAQRFYSLLVLQKVMAVNIDQAVPYDDIMVTKGPRFSDTAVI